MKKPVSRRVVLYGVTGALIAGCADSPSDTTTPPDTPPKEPDAPETDLPVDCVLTPDQIAGPFYFDSLRERIDITEGRPGVPVTLQLSLVDVADCTPIVGAVIDIWHADAHGAYSGYDEVDGNTSNESGQTFLRGYQFTDDDGLVTFETIFPGWYPGRTAHIHMAIRFRDATMLTTQLYFEDAIVDQVYLTEAYEERGPRDTTNAQDFIPQALVVPLTATAAGYTGSFRIGIATTGR